MSFLRRKSPWILVGAFLFIRSLYKIVCIYKVTFTFNVSTEISNTLQVSIEQVTTFSKAKVTIRHPSVYPTHWLISVRPAKPNAYATCTEHVFILRRQGLAFQQDFDFPISFKAGRKYEVVVQGLNVFAQLSTFVENSEFRIIGSGSVEFKAGEEVFIISLHAFETFVNYSIWI